MDVTTALAPPAGAPARRAGLTDVALAAGFVLAWSSGFVGAELGTLAAGAVTLLAWRGIVGTAVLLVARARRRSRRVGARELVVQAGIGVLSQAGYLLGVVVAISLGVPAGTAALVAALQPLMSGVLAGPVLGERVVARQWAGLVLGLGGVALVVAGDLAVPTGTPSWAYALPFAAMASLVAATLLERRLAPGADVADSLTAQTGASTVVFVAVAAGAGSLVPPADVSFWAGVVWTVVLSHLGGYALYWMNVRRGGVTRVGALLYLTPPATTLWAFAMFGEPFGVLAVVGMVVCALSVPLAVRRSRVTR